MYFKLCSHLRSLCKAPGRVACREYYLSLKPRIPAQGMDTGFPQHHSSSLGLLGLAISKTIAESSNLNQLPKPRNSLIILRTTQRPNQVSLSSWLCFGEILNNSKWFQKIYWYCQTGCVAVCLFFYSKIFLIRKILIISVLPMHTSSRIYLWIY